MVRKITARVNWKTEEILSILKEIDRQAEEINALKKELEKWKNHICGGGSQYRELGTTGLITNQMGDVWKKT